VCTVSSRIYRKLGVRNRAQLAKLVLASAGGSTAVKGSDAA
jgi:DNA-binding NarL/FixJ family response regulator